MKFRTLRASEIDVRVATINDRGCSLLLYKDARVDQNILDETVGAENWQRSHAIVGENLYCTVSLWDEKKNMWISKQDVGTESNTEKEKGQASDSFKRACFNWGIGRELYTAPFIWIDATEGNVQLVDGKNGKKTTYDTFAVKAIGYDKSGTINKLEIINMKLHKVVFVMGKAEASVTEDPAPEDQTPGQGPAEQASEPVDKAAILKALCKRKGVSANSYNGKTFSQLTDEEYVKACKELGAMPDKEKI